MFLCCVCDYTHNIIQNIGNYWSWKICAFLKLGSIVFLFCCKKKVLHSHHLCLQLVVEAWLYKCCFFIPFLLSLFIPLQQVGIYMKKKIVFFFFFIHTTHFLYLSVMIMPYDSFSVISSLTEIRFHMYPFWCFCFWFCLLRALCRLQGDVNCVDEWQAPLTSPHPKTVTTHNIDSCYTYDQVSQSWNSKQDLIHSHCTVHLVLCKAQPDETTWINFSRSESNLKSVTIINNRHIPPPWKNWGEWYYVSGHWQVTWS
jgi:hypothetical protein